MTKKKELDELTDEAAIRRIFPPEVVREAKKAAEKADKRQARKRKEPAETTATG